ncbi:hypothetical protein [Streptomyces sp. NPDC059788]|uniref:hypothetical protein n=1 Tax=Streptomyces sp. NPDC059788 TaxID=3346948 RepID=UPI00365E50AF
MELLIAAADFVQEHATVLSVGLGALRLAFDTVRGVRSLLLRRRTARRAPDGGEDLAQGIPAGERPQARRTS